MYITNLEPGKGQNATVKDMLMLLKQATTMLTISNGEQRKFDASSAKNIDLK